MGVDEKLCSKCKKIKHLSGFYKNKTKNTYSYNCKVCVRKRSNDRYRLNRDGHGEAARKHKLKAKFGLTISDFDNILIKQNGVCSICGKPELTKYKDGKIQRLSIDHCHISGNVRGLLCRKCNTALSAFDDDIDVLASAISYLINNKVKEIA